MRRQRAGCARRHCEAEPWIPRAERSGFGADPVIGAEWLRLIGGMKSVGAARRFGRRVAPFNSFDDRREPIGHIQDANLTSENVIAQRP